MTDAKGSVTYTLKLDKVCKGSVRYANDDGVNIYAPKPVAGLEVPPETITLTISAVK